MSKWNWKELKTYNIKQRVLILLAALILGLGGESLPFFDSQNLFPTMLVLIGAVFLFKD